MIDERFSREAFARLPSDSEEVGRLCRELGAEIASEIHQLVDISFRRVANQLRSLGHDLPEVEPRFDPEYNSWYYVYRRGDSADNERFHLRIHFNTQVCTFYPGSKWFAVDSDAENS